ncbi:MAG: putative sugar nucleotidyl transferase [Candidatus Brocadiales bacterium]
MRGICIFEDAGYAGLLPLTHNRASYQLRLGMYTLLERILRHYPGNVSISLFAREHLAGTLRERYPHHMINTLDPEADGYLFINGRTLDLEQVPLDADGKDKIVVWEDTLVYARLGKKASSDLSPDSFLNNRLFKPGQKTPAFQIEYRFANHIWDIVKTNCEELNKDCGAFPKGKKIQGNVHEGVHMLNPQKIFVGKGSSVKPGCVLDAEEGPVYIDSDVEVMPNAVITGPVYIGKGSTVLPAARLRQGTNVGEGCKVGGEISNSILHSHSNKQHDGFLGDSYVGSWVNIGAGTSTSNTKNTYGTVKAQLGRGKKPVDTKATFFGSAIGDHTMVGINMSLDAGTHIGCHSNVAGTGPVPKFLPAFTWFTDGNPRIYNMRHAFIVASRAMARRDKIMTAAEESMYQEIFALTTKDRKGMRK